MPNRRQAMLGLAVLPIAGCGSPGDASVDAVATITTATALPPMLSARATHVAVATTAGALMIGGFASEGSGIAMVERYDVVRRRFEVFATLKIARIQPVAVALDNHDVLVMGGERDAPISSAELLEPAGQITALGSMRDRRTAAAAVKLLDGRVLITGGSRPGYRMTASAEIYDPATRGFRAVAPMRTARAGHGATLLPDGRVLITGGGEGGQIERSTEVFDPATDRFVSAPPMRQARYKHAAILAADGSVLVIGGSDNRAGADGRGRLAECERYQPDSVGFVEAPRLTQARYKLQNAVVVLPRGDLIVASGSAGAEILRPEAMQFEPLAAFDTRRDFMTATLIGPRTVLATGGYDSAINGSNKAWLLDA